MAECQGQMRDGTPCRAQAQQGQELCSRCSSRIEFIDSQVTGRHKKYLPTRLFESYRAALEDPDLQMLKAEIALMDSRVNDLLARLPEDGDGSLYIQLVEELNLLVMFWDADQLNEARLKLDQVIAIASMGANERKTWDNIKDTTELRRKLAESETKRQATLHQSIPVERALALMGFITDALRRIVAKYVPAESQRAILTDMAAEIRTMTGTQGPLGLYSRVGGNDDGTVESVATPG